MNADQLQRISEQVEACAQALAYLGQAFEQLRETLAAMRGDIELDPGTAALVDRIERLLSNTPALPSAVPGLIGETDRDAVAQTVEYMLDAGHAEIRGGMLVLPEGGEE